VEISCRPSSVGGVFVVAGTSFGGIISGVWAVAGAGRLGDGAMGGAVAVVEAAAAATAAAAAAWRSGRCTPHMVMRKRMPKTTTSTKDRNAAVTSAK